MPVTTVVKIIKIVNVIPIGAIFVVATHRFHLKFAFWNKDIPGKNSALCALAYLTNHSRCQRYVDGSIVS